MRDCAEVGEGELLAESMRFCLLSQERVYCWNSMALHEAIAAPTALHCVSLRKPAARSQQLRGAEAGCQTSKAGAASEYLELPVPFFFQNCCRDVCPGWTGINVDVMVLSNVLCDVGRKAMAWNLEDKDLIPGFRLNRAQAIYFLRTWYSFTYLFISAIKGEPYNTVFLSMLDHRQVKYHIFF